MKTFMKRLLLFGIAVIVVACDTADPNGGGAEVRREGDKIIIVDQTGKSWDVTHAVNEYGFQAQAFQFGIGPFAIRPIQNPTMLLPGDPGYPSPQSDFLVIGYNHEGDKRAYPLYVMGSHEVVDEQFGQTHVAVAY